MRILIVDDNPEVAETFAGFCRAAGQEPTVVGSRGRCLRTLPDDYRPDRILVDASLPREFIQQIFDRYHVPAVGITGGPPANVNTRGIPVLTKPTEPATVLAALEHAGGN